MNRRSFLGSILLAGAAPAIVRADSLMRVIPRELGIVTPEYDIGIGAYDVEVVTGEAYGNRLLTISQIANQALEILNEQLHFAGKINAQYELFSADRIRVRRPVRYG